jgi:adenylate cyclase
MLGGAMGIEIERKFLPKGEAWRGAIDGPGALVRQGYLSSASHCTVRVRVKGERAWMTVKGISIGASRAEYEYPIPLEDATAMLDSLCEKPLIEKTRYVVRQDGVAFEIDEFHGANAGLVVIEVELASEDQAIRLPDWIGEEVTGDVRYRNSHLVRHPYAEQANGW